MIKWSEEFRGQLRYNVLHSFMTITVNHIYTIYHLETLLIVQFLIHTELKMCVTHLFRLFGFEGTVYNKSAQTWINTLTLLIS